LAIVLAIALAVRCAAADSATAAAQDWNTSAQSIVVAQGVLVRGTLRDGGLAHHRETPPVTLKINGEPLRLWRQTVCHWERIDGGTYSVILDLHGDPGRPQYFFNEPGRYEVEIAEADGGEVIFACQVDVSAPREEDKGALALMESVESVYLLIAQHAEPEGIENLSRLVAEFPDCPWRPYAEAALGVYYFDKARTPATPTVEQIKEIPRRQAALAGYFRAAAADETLGLWCWRARLYLGQCLALGGRYGEAKEVLSTVAQADLPDLSRRAKKIVAELDAIARKELPAPADAEAVRDGAAEAAAEAAGRAREHAAVTAGAQEGPAAEDNDAP